MTLVEPDRPDEADGGRPVVNHRETKRRWDIARNDSSPLQPYDDKVVV